MASQIMNALQTSRTLLNRLQDRHDQLAWESFVDIYSPLIHTLLYRAGVSEEDVEDLSQDCLAKILKSITGFAHNGRPGAFRTWLRCVVTNHAIRFFSRTARGKLALRQIAQWETQATHPLQTYLDQEHDQYVVSRLLDLIRPEFTATTWEAFSQQVMEGRSAGEVAESLDRSVNSVLLCKSRVLRRLRELGKGLVEC